MSAAEVAQATAQMEAWAARTRYHYGDTPDVRAARVVLDALAAAADREARVRALHPRVSSPIDARPSNDFCGTCRLAWPCSTVAALDPAGQDPT